MRTDGYKSGLQLVNVDKYSHHEMGLLGMYSRLLRLRCIFTTSAVSVSSSAIFLSPPRRITYDLGHWVTLYNSSCIVYSTKMTDGLNAAISIG